MGVVNNNDAIALELERVLPKLQVLYESDNTFSGGIEKKNVEKISSRQMRVPLEIAPGGSFQYVNADGGDLGRGGGPQYDKAVLTSVFMSENIEYTKQAEWGTDDSRKAILQVTKRLIARGYMEIRRQIESQYMQNGTGVVGVISAVTASATSDLYTLGTDGFGARLVRQGQTIQVFDTTLATNRGSAVITGYDVENKQITVQPAISGATGTDKLVVNGISTPTALPAIYGIPYHDSNASTGIWLGFDRSTTPQVRASAVNAASATLTLPLPRLAINKIGNRVGLDNNFRPEAWMHPCQKQAYEEIGQLVTVINKSAKEERLDMYFDGMQMAGAPVKESFNWDMTRIDFVSKEVWGRGEILPLGFYTTDGRKIFEIRGASGGVATADIFYLVTGFQAFVNNPAACSYIYGLAVPSGY